MRDRLCVRAIECGIEWGKSEEDSDCDCVEMRVSHCYCAGATRETECVCVKRLIPRADKHDDLLHMRGASVCRSQYTTESEILEIDCESESERGTEESFALAEGQTEGWTDRQTHRQTERRKDRG